MLLRCTSKVLKELKITKSQVDDQPESVDTLEEWYANLFYPEKVDTLKSWY